MMARASLPFRVWAALIFFTLVLGTPISLPAKKSATPGMISLPISRKSRSLSKRLLAHLSNREFFIWSMFGLDTLLRPYLSISIPRVATRGLSHQLHVAQDLVLVELVSKKFLMVQFELSFPTLLHIWGVVAKALDVAKEMYLCWSYP